MENDIKVSIVASAVRVKFWERFLNSLKQNKVKYEVVFVGDKKPEFDTTKYPEFKYIYSPTKPAQCYAIGFRASKGELVHWSCDDAIYVWNGKVDNIDKAYNSYKANESKYGDKKTVIAMRPIEDGGDVWDFHHFFGGSHNTPVMAPLGLMNRELLMELKGYHKNFISGQSENDLVMRVLEVGGRVDICMDSYIFIGHREAHEVPNPFRQWYTADRKILEDAWVLPDGKISNTRLLPVEPFIDDNILTITQGDKGKW